MVGELLILSHILEAQPGSAATASATQPSARHRSPTVVGPVLASFPRTHPANQRSPLRTRPEYPPNCDLALGLKCHIASGSGARGSPGARVRWRPAVQPVACAMCEVVFRGVCGG